MALPLYLAMTAAEMRGNDRIPPQFAYMACHFSSYGTALSNCPEFLPEGSLLILNDRTPIHGHDHGGIAGQLAEMAQLWALRGILLDFQRPDCEETADLTKQLTEVLPCPVGVSDIYAGGLDCPVFLPPAPPDTPLEAHLGSWADREIWLDTALEGLCITLTEDGAASAPLPFWESPEGGFPDEKLHCHYHINIEDSRVRFTLYRTREDVEYLLKKAEGLGVTLAVGLWQEFTRLSCSNDTERYPMV